MKDYFLYVDEGGDPEQLKEIELEIRDQETMEKKKVKALVARYQHQLPGADKLWLRDERAYRDRPDNPWAIKIVEEIEEEVEEVKVRQRAVFKPDKRRTDLIRSLIREKTR